MMKAATEVGHIFRPFRFPGTPEVVCVVDPEDVEAVFRVGDIGYPERYQVEVWYQARKEMNAPIGMFMV